MHYQVTVRFGGARQRYHTFVVEAASARAALRAAAGEIPDEIADDVDLVELRIAVDPERRSYIGEEDGAGDPGSDGPSDPSPVRPSP